jgi:MFS family permease
VYRSFLFGYDSGVMTDVIASPHFLEFFDTEPTSPIIGAINATFNGGAVFGALFGGVIMDKYGRRGTIFAGAVIASVGAILQSAAYQYVFTVSLGRVSRRLDLVILTVPLIVWP